MKSLKVKCSVFNAPTKENYPIIGIIGGSGFYDFPELVTEKKVRPKTEYGYPSDWITIGSCGGVRVAFLPRHGHDHKLAPHRIPYRANMEALWKIGVRSVVGACVVGSLRRKIKPGDLVLPDQFVNLTWGRDDGVRADGSFIHLPMTQPYCENLRRSIAKQARSKRIGLHKSGVVVVVQGPRFSTIAESRWFVRNSWDVVNMTQYPEVYFARERGICYAAVAAVTDYDAILHEETDLTVENWQKVRDTFINNIVITRKLLVSVIMRFPALGGCNCAKTWQPEFYKDL